MMLPDDKLITTALLRRFKAEGEMDGGTGQHNGAIRLGNGNLTVHHPYSPNLAPEQVMWANDILKFLNREIHHDGAWVLVFTHPKPSPQQCTMLSPTHCNYERYVLLWLDADGDVQIPVEWMAGEGDLLNFVEVVLAGPEATATSCEAAWQAWFMMMRQVLDPQEGQTFKRAQGQQAPSAQR